MESWHLGCSILNSNMIEAVISEAVAGALGGSNASFPPKEKIFRAVHQGKPPL